MGFATSPSQHKKRNPQLVIATLCGIWALYCLPQAPDRDNRQIQRARTNYTPQESANSHQAFRLSETKRVVV